MIISSVDRIDFPNKNKTSQTYYALMKQISAQFGLVYNNQDYARTFIETPRRRIFLTPSLVAYVESEAKVGELDDLTNERNPKDYSGLKIHLLDREYGTQVTNLGKIASAILKSDVEINLETQNIHKLNIKQHVPKDLQSRLKNIACWSSYL